MPIALGLKSEVIEEELYQHYFGLDCKKIVLDSY